MKRLAWLPNLSLLILSAFFVFVLAGCSLSSATAIQYDSHTPPERLCTLYVAGTLTVKAIDGESVAWHAGFADNWALVQIPEGSHTLVLDFAKYAQAGSLSTYNGTGLCVTYDRFQAGHTYLLVAEVGGAVGYNRYSLMVGIKDVTNEPDWDSYSKAMSWKNGVEWLPISFRASK